MVTVISFIIALGVLIFVHEFGHFIVAKAYGVKVLKFSLGFGSPLVSRKWGETEYLVSALPLGGYVKMYGESPDDEVDPAERGRSFTHKRPGQRFAIVFAGPFFNLLFAVFLFFCLFFFVGLPESVDSGVIGSVQADSPAARAGLQKGDLIVSINDQAISSWEQVSPLVRESGGKPVRVRIRRDASERDIAITPEMLPIRNIFGEEVGQKYMLGIGPSEEVRYVRASLGDCARHSVVQTWVLSKLTVVGIYKLIQRVVPASELGGPIRIAEIAGQRMKAGWNDFVFFLALLSINLGILNLLPVPILDGGHLAFLSLEMLRGKPVSERSLEIGQKIGIALLGALMIFVFYNDIARLVKQWMAS